MQIETFFALQLAGLRHGFSTRSQAPLEKLDDAISAAFTDAGFPMADAVHAEQPHGNSVFNGAFELDVLIAAVKARDQVFTAVFGPGDGTAQAPRQPDQEGISLQRITKCHAGGLLECAVELHSGPNDVR